MSFFHRNLTFVFFFLVNLDMSYSMLLFFQNVDPLNQHVQGSWAKTV